MRDRTVGETFHMYFTTRAFATGIPTVLAGTPVVSAYEDNSATQITAGITLGVDHDAVVGLNLLTLVATTGNGFGAGQDYSMVITTGTVGGVSVVGEVVGEFSLGLAAAFTRLGAPAGASVSADIAVIEGQTDDIGVAGAGLTAIPIVPANVTQISGDATAADNLELDYDGTGLTRANSTIGTVTLVTTTTTNTDMRGTDSAALASVATEARLAELDAANIPADLDAVLVNTGTTLPAQITALNDVSIADILASQLTQSYAADGVAPTLSQALFLIQQMLGDFAIAGTTLTVREIDGATTAATFTLDDAVSPTSLTRAT